MNKRFGGLGLGVGGWLGGEMLVSQELGLEFDPRDSHARLGIMAQAVNHSYGRMGDGDRAIPATCW